MATATVNFNKGLEIVTNAILNGEGESPFIVSFIGRPNSGKTTLSRRILDELCMKGVLGWVTNVNGNLDANKSAIQNPRYIIIEDVNLLDVCSEYCEVTFGKRPDFNVYLYKTGRRIPTLDAHDISAGRYNLIIRNSRAVRKM